MRTEDFRNTIVPILPANVREVVMAELELRDRQIAMLTMEHDPDSE